VHGGKDHARATGKAVSAVAERLPAGFSVWRRKCRSGPPRLRGSFLVSRFQEGLSAASVISASRAHQTCVAVGGEMARRPVSLHKGCCQLQTSAGSRSAPLD
jgi:hypothetical protein